MLVISICIGIKGFVGPKADLEIGSICKVSSACSTANSMSLSLNQLDLMLGSSSGHGASPHIHQGGDQGNLKVAGFRHESLFHRALT